MTMRERMARAMFGGRNRFIVAFDGKTYDQLNEESRSILLAVAEAVLDAMREPTEAMTRAGADCGSTPIVYRESARIIWTEMIDAAKEER